jgi:hypothetical protein
MVFTSPAVGCSVNMHSELLSYMYILQCNGVHIYAMSYCHVKLHHTTLESVGVLKNELFIFFIYRCTQLSS